MSVALGRYAEAAAAWDRGFALCDQAVVPSTYRLQRASCLIRAGEYENGLTAAEEVAKELGATDTAKGADHYKLASLFGLGFAAVNADRRLQVLERDRRAAACAASARSLAQARLRRRLVPGPRARRFRA